jgi:hypothetical protein
VVKFAPILSTAFSLELHVEGRSAALSLKENADLGDVRTSWSSA